MAKCPALAALCRNHARPPPLPPFPPRLHKRLHERLHLTLLCRVGPLRQAPKHLQLPARPRRRRFCCSHHHRPTRHHRALRGSRRAHKQLTAGPAQSPKLAAICARAKALDNPRAVPAVPGEDKTRRRHSPPLTETRSSRPFLPPITHTNGASGPAIAAVWAALHVAASARARADGRTRADGGTWPSIPVARTHACLHGRRRRCQKNEKNGVKTMQNGAKTVRNEPKTIRKTYGKLAVLNVSRLRKSTIALLATDLVF